VVRTGPMHGLPNGYLLASRAQDIGVILSDRRFGKDFVGRITRLLGADLLEQPAYRTMANFMVSKDPPDHSRLRGLVLKAFSPRQLQELRPRIHENVNRLPDNIEAKGAFDLVADFAYALPARVICDMLGIPEEERATFMSLLHFSGRLLEPVMPTPEELAAANKGILQLSDYLHGLFALRRREPGPDLTSHLVQAEEQGDKLSEDELTANVIFLYRAGHETTVNFLGNAMLSLHRNPDQLSLLRENPSLIGGAIEELLRYESPVQTASRIALDDVKVGGHQFLRGDAVFCLLGAANRDPDVYDDPNRLDIKRSNVRPFSFGGGVHYCLGAQLSRIESEIAITTMLRRMPNMVLDDAEHPEWRPNFTFRGLQNLPA